MRSLSKLIIDLSPLICMEELLDVICAFSVCTIRNVLPGTKANPTSPKPGPLLYHLRNLGSERK